MDLGAKATALLKDNVRLLTMDRCAEPSFTWKSWSRGGVELTLEESEIPAALTATLDGQRAQS